MIAEKEFKEKVMEIMKTNITLSPIPGNYIIVHGAIDKIWELVSLLDEFPDPKPSCESCAERDKRITQLEKERDDLLLDW